MIYCNDVRARNDMTMVSCSLITEMAAPDYNDISLSYIAANEKANGGRSRCVFTALCDEALSDDGTRYSLRRAAFLVIG